MYIYQVNRQIWIYFRVFACPYTGIVIGSSVFHKLAVSLQAKSLSPHEKLPKEWALRLRVVFRMSLDPFVVILFVCLFLVGRLFVKYFCILHFLFFFSHLRVYIFFSFLFVWGTYFSSYRLVYLLAGYDVYVFIYLFTYSFTYALSYYCALFLDCI